MILASELLQQLAPAFEEHIAHLAYHRDVNAHNILIDFEGNQPKYGHLVMILVVFGAGFSRGRGDSDAGRVDFFLSDSHEKEPISVVRITR